MTENEEYMLALANSIRKDAKAFIISIGNNGIIYRDRLNSILVLGSRDEFAHIGLIRYILTETAKQAVLIMANDPSVWVNRLINLPMLEYFQHIQELNDPVKLKLFANSFKEFAFSVISSINSSLAINHDTHDMALESCSDTYVIVKITQRFPV